jgi:hypothetical protein
VVEDGHDSDKGVSIYAEPEPSYHNGADYVIDINQPYRKPNEKEE